MSFKIFIFIFKLTWSYFVVLASGSPAATHLTVIHVGQCSDDIKYIVSVAEFQINTQTYDSTFSGAFNLSEDLVNGWRVKVTIQKCHDIRNMDTCDFFNSYYLVRDGCNDDDEAEQEIYAMMFHYSTPEIDCPVRAGRYYLKNYPFFTEDNYITVSEAKISSSVFGYTYILEGFDIDSRKIFCVEAYFKLLYMRNHNWLEKSNKTAKKN